MTKAPNQFCTAITCMDGRIQDSVADFLRGYYKAQWVDTVTEAGPVGALSEGNPQTTRSVCDRVSISVEKHDSAGIGVIAHEGCAAVPLPREEQIPMALNTAERMRKKFPSMEVIALYAKLNGEIELLKA
ncbi:MAG: hypothetical protein GY747_04400 [Planctomycetes bacterium]|nr:hypothetical protein [Planctomycetota bacterium]MCP4771501.1 hypothetical protein [Planctomycetota bacterium]MCP4861162.1 hypothetical protein [Planctomycetota bacterium]